jgi:tetratricopeptide (TPR) repeat protein
MIDAQGRVAAYTGGRAIRAAGHRVGVQYSVQANLMEKATVWPAMARAFESTSGDLAERLLAALEAAEREGGDIRGRQSAAILVVGPRSSGRPWTDRRFDLRVEDHPNPVNELRRLVTLARVYQKLNEGDEWVTKNDMPRAVEAYGAATSLLPDEATNGEAVFWTGISLASAKRVDEAIPYLRRAQAADPRWAELVTRLPEVGLLPNDQALVRRLVDEMKKPGR